MTHQTDLARGQEIVARWCSLAEQRLEHLTELLETGRWRRYHSEAAFEENLVEAKAAVATWRELLSREAALNNSPIDLSWLGRGRSKLPLYEAPLVPEPKAEAEPIILRDMDAVALAENTMAAMTAAFEAAAEVLDETPVAPPMAPAAPRSPMLPVPSLDIRDMQARYPLLRNSL